MTKQLPGYNWLTVRVEDKGTPDQPVYDGGIDLVLTQNERSKAALAAAKIEEHKINRNKADDALAEAKARRALAAIELS